MPDPQQPPGRLGTFAGVFTPSILTILGIILFLRLGFVVGSAGFGRALLIIAAANVVTVLTSISLSAVATNLRVKGGGDYYLISRTLGVHYGGALGLVLFLAQSVSIGFYCIGFGEAVAALLPAGSWAGPQPIAAAALALLFVLAWMGADVATRFQYVVMAFLVAALVAFFTGGLPQWDPALVRANWAAPDGGPGFWVLFAIFFPAVTGFTQGVSMSGDLRDPGRSLPRGTFAAVGLSILVYLAVATVFAGTLPAAVMAGDYAAMKRVAAWPHLIDAGVIAATLSSAMASFLGAPRILQSLARDRIFPLLDPFAAGAGPAENPRRGVLLAFALAGATILSGSLNLVASVVSMFFLISYGLINYATFFEARTRSPSFRPRFRWFHPRLSLAGALACLGGMLAIDFRTGLVALALLAAIYQYLKRTAGPARWADSQRSHALQRIRENLLTVAAEPPHDRDWRPQMLVFTDEPGRRQPLLRLAAWLEGGAGMATVARFIEGRVASRRKRRQAEEELRRAAADEGLQAFALAVYSSDLQAATQAAVQAYGIGPLRANTALINWLPPVGGDGFGFRDLRFGRELQSVFRLGCNLVLLYPGEKGPVAPPGEGARIDVWWPGEAHGRLLLLLAHLMTRHPDWEGAAVRVLAPRRRGGGPSSTERLQTVLEEARIDGTVQTVSALRREALTEHSRDAGMLLLPFRFRNRRVALPFEGPVEEVLAGMPPAALVLAAEDIHLDAEPEAGIPGEIAAAQDARDALLDKLRRAEKAVGKANAQVDLLRRRQEIAAISGTLEASPAEVEETAGDLAAAERQAEKLHRKAVKAKVKVAQVIDELETLGVPRPAEDEEGEG